MEYYFSLEYRGMKPKTEAVPPSQAPSIHPTTSAFIGLGPIHVPNQAPFVVSVEPILSFALVMEHDHAHLTRIQSDPICRMGSCSITQDILVWWLKLDVLHRRTQKYAGSIRVMCAHHTFDTTVEESSSYNIDGSC
jgi:hypothetical protein